MGCSSDFKVRNFALCYSDLFRVALICTITVTFLLFFFLFYFLIILTDETIKIKQQIKYISF